MPQRRNEVTGQIRQEPFAYCAVYDGATGLITYEAWADAGSLLTDVKWIACAYTYDANKNIVRTKWAIDSQGRIGDFTNAAGTDNATIKIDLLNYQ